MGVPQGFINGFQAITRNQVVFNSKTILRTTRQVTFQNIQGQTIRGPEGEPKGYVLDMYRPQTMRGSERDPEYFQHIYMGLGRAQKLDRVLLRNFPRTSDDELDWSIFEDGPPDYVVKFMGQLERLAAKTLPKLLQAQRELGMPAWEDVPHCEADGNNKGRYLYDPTAWKIETTYAVAPYAKHRLARKRAAPEPPASSAPASPKKARRLKPPEGTPAAVKSPKSTLRSKITSKRHELEGDTGGWWCSLLKRSIGKPIAPPPWFNDRRCQAVNLATGTQSGLTCGLFAVNHCLASGRGDCLALAEFKRVAGDGCYAEGDFDDCGLYRNLQRKGYRFERLQGEDHQEAVRQVDEQGGLSIFSGVHAFGCILHQPSPRHWVAIVRPEAETSEHFAAVLCDSLRTHVFALSVTEMVDLFTMMGVSHMAAGESNAPLLQQEQNAARWSVYSVSKDHPTDGA